MMRWFFLCCAMFLSPITLARPVVNVYAWGGEIPASLIQEFERRTGIKVNFSTYDSNETLYAKLRASKHTVYDVIIPSAYYVERMRKQGLLTHLDHRKLPNLRHIDPLFKHQQYDPNNQYGVPLIWGATGIFYNQQHVKARPTSWQSLWNPHWDQQLMLLDDAREVFAIGLMSLGFSPNDTNPDHIDAAFKHLRQLIPNIKLFSSDGIQAIIIDEDAVAGIAWNGDVLKANAENQAIQFVFPKPGFVVWVDCLAIPQQAPHPKAAYRFINYLLEPQSATQIALQEGHAITNQEGKSLLPKSIRENTLIYPDKKTLKHAYFQRDVGEDIVTLYNQYWQALKLSF